PQGRVDFFLDVGRRRIDRRGAEERDELAPAQIEDRSVGFSIADAARLRVRSRSITRRFDNKTCAHRYSHLAARSIGRIRCRRALEFGLARKSCLRRARLCWVPNPAWPAILLSSFS